MVSLVVSDHRLGLFVPKPTTVEGYQRHSVLDLGQTVRGCPLASTAVGGDCYSLRYSVVLTRLTVTRRHADMSNVMRAADPGAMGSHLGCPPGLFAFS